MQIWHLSSGQGVMEKTGYLSATPPVKAISPYWSAPRQAILSFACKLVCVFVRVCTRVLLQPLLTSEPAQLYGCVCHKTESVSLLDMTNI